MARTHGTTSLAERTQPQGRSTESLYYLSLIVGEEAGQRIQTRVIPTKSAFLYFHPEAAHRRATYPRVATEKYTIILQNAFLLACDVCSLHNAKRIKGINNLT